MTDLRQALGLCIFALVMVTVCFILAIMQRDDLQDEAIERGYAEFVVKDGYSRLAEFKWKESTK